MFLVIIFLIPIICTLYLEKKVKSKAKYQGHIFHVVKFHRSINSTGRGLASESMISYFIFQNAIQGNLEVWGCIENAAFYQTSFYEKQAGQVLTHIIIILWWASCPSEAPAKVESFVIIVYNFLYPPARTQ